MPAWRNRLCTIFRCALHPVDLDFSKALQFRDISSKHRLLHIDYFRAKRLKVSLI